MSENFASMFWLVAFFFVLHLLFWAAIILGVLYAIKWVLL